MTSLYNCKHDGDEYRITKFDADMNIESSYLLSLLECTCPAAERSTCRHRQMLPKFIAREAVGTEWFYDFDRGGWVHITFPHNTTHTLTYATEELQGLEYKGIETYTEPGAEPEAGFIAAATDFAETLAKPMDHPNMFVDPHAAPGHDDLMVTPESIDEFLIKNPLNAEPSDHRDNEGYEIPEGDGNEEQDGLEPMPITDYRRGR